MIAHEQINRSNFHECFKGSLFILIRWGNGISIQLNLNHKPSQTLNKISNLIMKTNMIPAGFKETLTGRETVGGQAL